ncbi:MAG: family 20 glycosylhydrolase [Planctomycetota bacterium]|nr:family 20 glycosylhydrolase [Planctomycetota bacterium]
MSLSLLPQPKSVKTLVGTFDFKEVDTIFLAKKASKKVKDAAQLLAAEMKLHHHIDYQVLPSASVTDLHGCIITHHTREGIFVKTTLAKPQAYELLAAGHTLTVSAADDGGFWAATRTIRQLLQEGTRIPAMKMQDWPAVAFRAIHLDLKGLTPNLATLKEFLERAAYYKFNAVLVEYEDRFPFECLPDVRGPQAFTPETLKEFLAFAEQHGLEVVPLVQTLGHWEFILRHEKYRELAEAPDVPQQVCPSNPKAQKLIKEMIREIVAAHPHSEYIHLGADETWQLGQCHVCRAAGQKKNGKHELFLDHVLKCVRQVKAAGKHALIWDDMLREMPPELVKKVPKDTGVCYWKYNGHGGQYKAELLPQLPMYREAGFPIFGCSAIKGAGEFYTAAPGYRQRMDNVDWWVEAAETQPNAFRGHIATAWARFNSNLTPCDPLPSIWPSALYAAERSWVGLGSSRESFERRLLAGFYGLRPEAVEVAQAHYGLSEQNAKVAAEVLGQAKRNARRNRDVIEFLELAALLEVLNHERKVFTEQAGAMLPALESGRAIADLVSKLKGKMPGWSRQIEYLRKEFARVLLKRFPKDEVEEFIQDRLLISERFYNHLSNLLKRN